MAEPFTRLLERSNAGDGGALSTLMPLVYDELRALARSVMRGRSDGCTLQPTALVNDAYMKMVGSAGSVRSRAHFFAIAARVMRQVLADHARGKNREKRGGGWRRVTLHDTDATSSEANVDLLALDQALTELAQVRPEYTTVVELRFFAGLSIEEVADHLGASRSTIKNHWRSARAWLKVRLEEA